MALTAIYCLLGVELIVRYAKVSKYLWEQRKTRKHFWTYNGNRDKQKSQTDIVTSWKPASSTKTCTPNCLWDLVGGPLIADAHR